MSKPRDTMELTFITPQLAQELLQLNTNNRKPVKNKVYEYTGNMLKGEWLYIADVIKISDTGILLDGQHRLMSIVKSGVSGWYWINRGVPNTAFPGIDMGKKRSSADTLYINGVGSSIKKSALARVIMTWEKTKSGTVLASDSTKSGGGGGGYSGMLISNNEILEFVNMVDLSPYISKGKALCQKLKVFGDKDYSFLYYLFAKKSVSDADSFFECFTNEAHPPFSDCIQFVSRKLTNALASKERFTGKIKMMYMIKAWNAFRSKKNIKLIRLCDNEQMPEIL